MITFLVKKTIEDIRGQIQKDLILHGDLFELVKEDEEITRRREEIEYRIKALEDAQITFRLVSGSMRTSFDIA